MVRRLEAIGKIVAAATVLMVSTETLLSLFIIKCIAFSSGLFATSGGAIVLRVVKPVLGIDAVVKAGGAGEIAAGAIV